MAERIFRFTVMVNNDHSHWITVDVKAKNETTARKKLDKKMAKIANTWLVDNVETP